MLLKRVIVKNNVKLDFLHLEEYSDGNADIFSNTRYKPTLNSNSRFLVTFDNGTTLSQGVADVALGYTFSVYKEITGTNRLIYVSRIDEGQLSVVDYNVINNTNYTYYIFKEGEETISEAVVSNSVDTCWWDWSLIDVVPSATNKNLYIAVGDIWKFNLNIASGGRTQTMNTTVYDTLARFPKVSTGKLNYAKGSLSCILGNVQKVASRGLQYVEPVSLLENWNEFCANGNIKLLKDRKGNAMLVSITDNASQLDDITSEQVNTITFTWAQVEDASGVSIIGE